MNILLYFALPVATIILAIVLEKILRCPFLTAATFFAIYLIVAFAAFDASFLIFAIAYTILAFIAAYIAECLFQRSNNSGCSCNRLKNTNSISLSSEDISRIANQVADIQNNNNNRRCNCNNSNTSDVATVNVTNNTTGGRTTWCCYRR